MVRDRVLPGHLGTGAGSRLPRRARHGPEQHDPADPAVLGGLSRARPAPHGGAEAQEIIAPLRGTAGERRRPGTAAPGGGGGCGRSAGRRGRGGQVAVGRGGRGAGGDRPRGGADGLGGGQPDRGPDPGAGHRRGQHQHGPARARFLAHRPERADGLAGQPARQGRADDLPRPGVHHRLPDHRAGAQAGRPDAGRAGHRGQAGRRGGQPDLPVGRLHPGLRPAGRAGRGAELAVPDRLAEPAERGLAALRRQRAEPAGRGHGRAQRPGRGHRPVRQHPPGGGRRPGPRHQQHQVLVLRAAQPVRPPGPGPAREPRTGPDSTGPAAMACAAWSPAAARSRPR